MHINPATKTRIEPLEKERPLPDRPLSFLVICVDQMQGACLGIHGHPDVQTPNLDALARSGTSFRRAYCANSVCMPSRASMITGLTPRQHGVITNGTNLPGEVPTLGAALMGAGYRTHAAGKLHLQSWSPACYVPEGEEPGWSWEDGDRWNRGTIERLPLPYYGYQSVDMCGGHVDYCFGDYRRWLKAEHGGVFEQYAAPPGERVAPDCWPIDVPPELHYNTWIADRSREFITSLDNAQPFFLWCSFPDPHHPFSACAEYKARFDPSSLTLPSTWNVEEDAAPTLTERRNSYRMAQFDETGLRQILAETYGMIAHVDECVGRVIEALDQSGRADDTVIVFTADHGEYLGAHHLVGKNLWHLEELVRVPYIWHIPGQKAQGVRDDIVSHLDLVPTILELAGLSPQALCRRPYGGYRHGGISEPPAMPGRSLGPTLRKDAPLDPKPALIEFDSDNEPGHMIRMRTVIDGDWKLIYYGTPGEAALFNLADDPEERVNRFHDPSCIEVRATLMETMIRTLIRTDRLEPPPVGPS